jgi:hypothetical protein
MIGYTHSKGYAVNKCMAADMVTTVIMVVSDTTESQGAEWNPSRWCLPTQLPNIYNQE